MARDVVRTICPYCAVGCQLHLVVADHRAAGLEYLGDGVSEGSLCIKGNVALELLDHPDRLRYPQLKVNGRWQRIGWDQAVEIVCENLQQIRERDGSDALGFLGSAKCTNEENYLFQKLARLLGTDNIDHCARLCHASTLAGLTATLGTGAMTNSFVDLANARCLFIVGSNLSENHPVVCRWILRAKESGAKVIVADPRYTPTAWFADQYLQVRPGSDIALVNGMMHTIIKEGLFDAEFVAQRTSGMNGLVRLVQDCGPEKVADLTGIAPSEVVKAARTFAQAQAAAIIYCMGITQHVNGSRSVMNCANLAMLCGQVGRPGTGIYPIRGQDNVQGACDMGGLTGFYPGYQEVADPGVRQEFAAFWGVPRETLPATPGLTVLEMEAAAHEARLKAMYIIGENPLVSSPNSQRLRTSLKRLEFLVVQDIFPNETTELAHLLLPAAAWAEKSGSKTASDRRVQWSFRAVDPPGEARPDWWILCRVAEGLGLAERFGYGSPEEILAEIARVTPIYRGLTPDRLKQVPGGIHWPCLHIQHPGTPIMHGERFATPDGRGLIIPVGYQASAEQVDDEHPFVLTTGRLAEHYNSGAMSRRSKALSRRVPEASLEMNVQDARRGEIDDGDLVRVATRRGEVTVRARLTDAISPGVVFLPFHFQATNELTSDALDPAAKIPEYKVAACRVDKVRRS